MSLITYLKILPLMETSEVNGHFLSTYVPSMADCGGLKPRINTYVRKERLKILTKTNFLIVSRSGRLLLSHRFLGVLEDSNLLLESFFGL